MDSNKKSHYNKKLKQLVRNLRNDSTTSEIILWSKVLRAKKMLGFQFNRQFSMKLPKSNIYDKDLNIIVDFICRKAKLIIEVDGNSHLSKFEQDFERDKRLSEIGYTILRIGDMDVKKNLTNVILSIEHELQHLSK